MRIEVEKDEVVAPRDFVPIGSLSRSVVDYIMKYLIVSSYCLLTIILILRRGKVALKAYSVRGPSSTRAVMRVRVGITRITAIESKGAAARSRVYTEGAPRCAIALVISRTSADGVREYQSRSARQRKAE